MIHQPRVSVVIPLYNKHSTVERSVRSVIDQTFSAADPDAVEILVVDDGSTDDGAERILSIAQCHPNVHLIRQPNLGPGAARNRGIEAARAPFIAFLDADDEWLPEFLERSIASLESNAALSAVVSGYFEGPERRATRQDWEKKGLRTGVVALGPDAAPGAVFHLLNFLNSWAMVVRREALARYGGFYEKKCLYGEDSYLWLQILLNEPMYVELDPLCWWHNEASGLSRNLAGPRPVEPFFTDPSPLFRSCAPAMVPVLRRLLALRAGKTALVLGCWGRWQQAREILKRFTTTRDLREPRVLFGHLAATPVGAFAGWVVRRALSLVPTGARVGSTTIR